MKNNLESIGNKNPFTVPEGYFEGLTEQIMSRLPERVSESEQPASAWERMKPWLYMAAMFAGLYLMINLFTQIGAPKATPALTSSADIEEYYRFYEDYWTQANYEDWVYSEREIINK
jgi:hypothetical protein